MSAQQQLISAISACLDADPRVLACWLSGSLARGDGDGFSDVDTLVLVQPESYDDFCRDYRKTAEAIADPVLVRFRPDIGVLNVVSADWQRFDLSIVKPDGLARQNARTLKTLFNKSSFEPPFRARADYQPSPQKIADMIVEFYRIMGLLPVILGREEYANAPRGVGHLRELTISLMLEENRLAPDERGGALHLNRLLTPEQRAELEALPALDSRRDSIVEAHRAFAGIFVPRARKLAAALNAAWPDAFARATARHLEPLLVLAV